MKTLHSTEYNSFFSVPCQNQKKEKDDNTLQHAYIIEIMNKELCVDSVHNVNNIYIILQNLQQKYTILQNGKIHKTNYIILMYNTLYQSLKNAQECTRCNRSEMMTL